MTGRAAVLGSADVDDAVLAAMVSAQLGVDRVEDVEACAEVAAYDLEALTTAGRYWVRGTARHGVEEARFAFFVKVVQSWERSPLFQMVPEEMREQALLSMPWRREPSVYASDLGDRLPEGLTMPQCYGVHEIDELSAAVWLECVDVDPAPWDLDRFARAAYLLGRLAASERVAPLGALGEIPDVPRTYYFSRFVGQVVPALSDDDLWRHPVMAAAFDRRLRDDMRAAADGILGRLSELDALPLLTLHGDACPRNLLVPRGAEDAFVLIDYGFWGRGPAGFDLTQLLVGEIQLGERPATDMPRLEAVCVPAYVDGLRDEGVDLDVEEVRSGHAVMMLLFAGLSAIPFELLAEEPSEESVRVATERAAAARYMLDLASATAAV
jgi:hypothetical protein